LSKDKKPSDFPGFRIKETFGAEPCVVTMVKVKPK
jgi:hypothetical protein